MSDRFVPSVCPHDCPSTCALDVEVLDPARIGRVRGAKGNDFTAGVICAKVARYAERAHHPDRLTTPLRRVGAKGEGRFEPVGWDAALDAVAAAFRAAAARNGPQAVWPYRYAGTMGLVQRDGIDRLTHAMGYSRQHKTICSTIASAGWKAGVGAGWGADPRTMREADLIVLWGINAVSTHLHVMTLAAEARKKRGAKIVVVDPYRNPTAEKADVHLAVRPGTDGALACAVMHVLLAEGMADRDYMARYTDDPARLEDHLKTRTPAWAAAITGLAADDIVAFARMYGSTPRSFIRIGYGMSRSRNGASNIHAVSCLPAVSGAWRHPGGGALQSNGGLYAALDLTLIEGRDALDPAVRLLDMSQIGRVLNGDGAALKGGPPVDAMLIQNCNPAVVAPESTAVRRGLARNDLFVCVHEQFMTETARFADIVLPATTFLEHDDIYRGGGHLYLQVARAVIEPHAQCRSNHAVLCALAARLGADHRGFGMTAREIIDETLRASGLPGEAEAHAKGWIDCSKPLAQANHLDGFGHADGRFHFAPDWEAVGLGLAGLPELPDHAALIDAPTADRPYRLVTAPARNFLNTSFTETETSRRREGRPTARIHPDDCASLGLEEGELVRLGNDQGAVLVHVQPFDGLQPGVVVVETIWPHDAYVGGEGINVLTSADAAPPDGGAPFHDTAIWMERA